MNTTDERITIATRYYHAMLNKDFETMASYLSNDVFLLSPLTEFNGKDEVVHAAKHFGEILQDINIRAQFANNHQVMLAYDMTVPEPVG